MVGAEEAGDGCSVISDHYAPWLEEQGHSPYAGAVPGTAGQATDRIPLTMAGAEPPGALSSAEAAGTVGGQEGVSGCEQS